MSHYTSDNEDYGTKVLTGAMIAGALFLAVAFMSGLSPDMGKPREVAQVTSTPVQEVVVVTAPRHAKQS